MLFYCHGMIKNAGNPDCHLILKRLEFVLDKTADFCGYIYWVKEMNLCLKNVGRIRKDGSKKGHRRNEEGRTTEGSSKDR